MSMYSAIILSVVWLISQIPELAPLEAHSLLVFSSGGYLIKISSSGGFRDRGARGQIICGALV